MTHLQMVKVLDQWKNIAFLRPAEVSRTFLHKFNTVRELISTPRVESDSLVCELGIKFRDKQVSNY